MAENSLGRVELAIAATRDTAKWLATAFGAVGLSIAAGSQLSDIGALEPGPRLGLAAAGAVIAMLSTLSAVWAVARVLVHDPLTLSELATLEQTSPEHPAVVFLTKNKELLSSLDSVSQLHSLHSTTLEQVAKAHHTWRAAQTREARADAREAMLLHGNAAAQYAQVAKSVLLFSDFAMHRQRFRHGVLIAFVLSGMAALGLALFAWASHPPKEPSGTEPVAILRGA